MAFFYEAYLYDKMGKKDDALTVYKKAALLDPSLAVATHNIGLLLVEKKFYEEAVEFYKKSLQNKPRNPLYWVNLGKAYQKWIES